MSGHSKWATIKRKKGANDAKRGQLFARLIKAIEAAARDGGPDPDMNATLATAVQKAKDSSVPKDNITRALERASGKDAGGAAWETMTYEGYAPCGVAVYITCLTDNRNRAAADVRTALNKNGGNLAEPGAVNYLFSRKGIVVVSSADTDEEELMMVGLDNGMEEMEDQGEVWSLSCEPSDVNSLRKALEDAGYKVESSDSPFVPSMTIDITTKEDAQKVMRVIDALEDCDDVQEVFANFDIPDEIMESLD